MSRRIIAVIPARAGSLGLPGKATIEGPKCHDRTLIEWTLFNVKEAGFENSDIIVTTNDGPTYGWAAGEGGVRSILRSNEPREIELQMKSVLLEVDCKQQRGSSLYAYLLVYPTYPKRNSSDLESIRDFYNQDPKLPVIGLKTSSNNHPYRFVKVSPMTNELESVIGNKAWNTCRRQEYPPMYEICHAACVVPAELLHKMTASLVLPESRPYWLTPDKCVDIDTMADLEAISKEPVCQASE